MIVIITILVIIIILYIKYYHINEKFTVNNFAYLSLNPDNYPAVANDHYYYNNAPFSETGGMSLLKKSGGTYCNNGKGIPFRQKSNYQIQCNKDTKYINQIFNVDVEGLSNKMINRAKSSINKYENSTIKPLTNELTTLINRYIELNDEITFAKKFYEENEYSSKKFREYNKNLNNKLDKDSHNINFKSQQILLLKDTYNSHVSHIDKIHKYTKYILFALAILTIIYLLNKKYTKTD